MSTAHLLIPDLLQHQNTPKDGILTCTLLDNDHLKSVLFSFSQGQELSEHTASVPAVLHFLDGTAELVLGRETTMVNAGAWVHLPARAPHSIRAKTAVTMLLLMFKGCS